jgi:ketosteroid isomerase-like protein
VSQENAEIVLAAYKHLNRGDVDALIDLCDDDFLMDMSERVFNPDTYRGSQDIRRFYEGVYSVWGIYQWDVTQTHVVDDAVVAMVHCRGQGREGGPWAEWHVAWLWRVQGGQLASVRFYRDPPRALKAVGLEE